MRSRVHFFVGFSLLLTTAASSFAQRNLKDIPPPDPQLEQDSFILAEGFEVNLYASDPLLAKPIQMNFDERGRLWVASSEVYPQIEPGQEATDKILVLEDSNHDGVADRTDAFADGLLIPTGVIPGDGGAYVANSTELLHMADGYYASAEAGMRFIPWRARFAILVSSRVYRGIGSKLRWRGADPWPGRTVVSPLAKVGLATVALFRGLHPMHFGLWPAPRHTPALHRGLAGLPGTATATSRSELPSRV